MKPITVTLARSHNFAFEGSFEGGSFTHSLAYNLLFDTSSLLPVFLNVESKFYFDNLKVQVAKSAWMFEEWNTLLNDFWFHISGIRPKSQNLDDPGAYFTKAGFGHKERHYFNSFVMFKLFGFNHNAMSGEPKHVNFLKNGFLSYIRNVTDLIDKDNVELYQPIAISQHQPTITGFLASSDFSVALTFHNYFKLNSKIP